MKYCDANRRSGWLDSGFSAVSDGRLLMCFSHAGPVAPTMDKWQNSKVNRWLGVWRKYEITLFGYHLEWEMGGWGCILKSGCGVIRTEMVQAHIKEEASSMVSTRLNGPNLRALDERHNQISGGKEAARGVTGNQAGRCLAPAMKHMAKHMQRGCGATTRSDSLCSARHFLILKLKAIESLITNKCG